MRDRHRLRRRFRATFDRLECRRPLTADSDIAFDPDDAAIAPADDAAEVSEVDAADAPCDPDPPPEDPGGGRPPFVPLPPSPPGPAGPG